MSVRAYIKKLYLCYMKKGRFITILLCGILSLCLIVVMETIWSVDTYRNMRYNDQQQVQSILNEATRQYITSTDNSSVTIGRIERLYTIVEDVMLSVGMNVEYMVEVLSTTDSEPIVLASKGSENIGGDRMSVERMYTPIILRLTVDDPHSEIVHSMRFMLILQSLSVILLVATFIYLIRTLFRAKSLDKIRRDLTHNITHELKTPIAAAYAATDMLRTTPDIAQDEQLRNEYLDMTLGEIKRLETLVEEILRSSTEEFEYATLHLEECRLADVVGEVSATLDLKYSGRNVSWRVDIKDDIFLFTDRFHLGAVISALVDNAIKYSPANPMVAIVASVNEKTVTIIVEDNGIGIPSGERRRIFDKFYRVSQGNRHDTKGFGLGLYYVQNIVRRLGGSIGLVSKVGCGSQFILKLPRYVKK